MGNLPSVEYETQEVIKNEPASPALQTSTALVEHNGWSGLKTDRLAVGNDGHYVARDDADAEAAQHPLPPRACRPCAQAPGVVYRVRHGAPALQVGADTGVERGQAPAHVDAMTAERGDGF